MNVSASMVYRRIRPRLLDALGRARTEIGRLPGQPLRLLLAVSGGRDSMVMLDMLASEREALSLELAALTVDHGLRVESQLDAAFVEEQCALRDIPCSPRRLRPPSPARNIEAWGRKERYRLLEEERTQLHADFVATAHHANDQVETMLLRLCSGRLASSSYCIEALSRERKLLRPLLDLTAAEILEYARVAEVQYREDASNSDACFLRNRVRHEVLPMLRDVFSPSVDTALLNVLGRLNEDEHVLEGQTIAWRRLRALAREQLGASVAHRISYADYQRVAATLAKPSSRVREIELGGQLFCQLAPSGAARFFERAYEAVPVPLDIPALPFVLESNDYRVRLFFEEVERPHPVAAETSNVCLPCDLLSPSTVLRYRRSGDYVQLAHGKRRSLKKLLQDLKVAPEDRWRLPLLARDNQVLWVPGVLVSAPQAATQQQHLCRIRCEVLV